jgi:site-specific DNA recombinase
MASRPSQDLTPTAASSRAGARRVSPQRIGPGGPGPTSPWSVISRVSTMGERVPVAGLVRVSTDDLQDPVGSATRQVGNCLAALPAGWEVVAWFVDIESGRMELDERGAGTAHRNLTLPVRRAGGLGDHCLRR